MKKLGLLVLLSATALSSTAFGHLRKHPAPEPVAKSKESNMGGFYLGAQGGYEFINTDTKQTNNTTGAFDKRDLAVDGGVGGVFLGYNHMMDRVLLGLEADFEFSGADGSSSTQAGNLVKVEKEWGVGVAARLGYEIVDQTVLYAKVGWRMSEFEVSSGINNYKHDNELHGVEFGLGTETMLSENFSMRLQYTHTSYEDETKAFGTNSVAKINPEENKVQIGFAFHF